MVLPVIMMMAALSAPGNGDALSAPELPVLLGVDVAEQTVALERPGSAPSILALDEADAQGWILRSVAEESATFDPADRSRDTPVRVRVYLKASGRRPLVVRDRVEVPAVPRLLLSPVRSMTAAEAKEAQGSGEAANAREQQ